MAVVVHNLTLSPLALPAPFEAVLDPLSATRFDYIEYDAAINDARIVDLINKGVLRVESEDDVKRPSNAVTVAQSGGDFTSIQAAIDSITDAGPTNPYVVQVYPGVYDEQLTMKAYVSIDGVADIKLGSSTVTLSTSGTAVTWPDGALWGSISGITFQVTNAPNATDRLFRVGAAQFVAIVDCFCYFMNPTTAATAVEITGATQLTFQDCTLFCEMGPLVGVNTRRFVHLNANGAAVGFRDCGLEFTVNDPDDDVVIIDSEAAYSGDTGFQGSVLKVRVTDAAYSGTAIGIRLLGNLGGAARDTEFSVDSQNAVPGSGRIYYLDNGGGGNKPITHGCSFVVGTNFASAYLAEILAGSELVALSARFEVPNILIGAGTIHYSGADDNFYGIRTNLPARFEDTFLAEDPVFAVPNIKSGINQGAAGAAAGELWADTSAGNVIKLGV